MTTRAAILRLLADGGLHSGAVMGAKLGISRAAVCKGVQALAASGLDVQAVTGRGYRLDASLVPLERRKILRLLRGAGSRAPRIDILDEVDSTNRELLAHAVAATDPSGHVLLAEMQPQGRGRRGRRWIATPYQNLMLSMSWRFAGGPATLAGLSLAAGVAIVQALQRYGARGVGLKWPNDVLWKERKLAGLLIDVQGEAGGPSTVVVGIGINCRIAPADARRIDQPWADLATLIGATVDRNRLAALTIEELRRMFSVFAKSGLAAFHADWERCHLHAGQPVRVLRGADAIHGTVEGVDESGALRLRDAAGRVQVFHSGEVSLRQSRAAQ